MKKLNCIFCMLFLCMMVSTWTVSADDSSFDGGAGIKFEGSADIEPTPTPTGTPSVTGKPSGTGTGSASGGKTSLPQTGQRADQILPAAGCAILMFAGWRLMVKNRRNGSTAGTIIRKEHVPY